MTIAQAKTVFMLGIGGTGMRGLATLLAGRGKTIVGSDQQYDVIKDWPDLKDFEIVPEDLVATSDVVTRADVLIYTDAAEPTHPLIAKAKEQGIPVLPYQVALGELSKEFTTIAVTGTHGKSSTTAFLAHILIETGKDPTVLVGAPIPAWGGGARVGRSDLFVVEADEYREHFLTLTPAHAIIVSVDFDHPDYFKSLEHVKEAYERFKKLVAGAILTSEDLAAEDFVNVPAPLPGTHMQQNAALAIKMAGILGVPREQATAALKTFPGMGRRFEKLGVIGSMEIYTDYGHHPREIEVTIAAARSSPAYAGRKRLLVVFEAHTLERLKVFFENFREVLSRADGVLLVPVFIPAGREHESAEALQKLQALQAELPKNTWRIDDYGDLPGKLNELSTNFDVAFAFTAGRLDAELRKIIW